MANTPSHHVVPRDDGWAVRKQGASRDSSRHGTKAEAIDAARAVSRNQHTELVIHRKDGTIQKRDSHGSDPCPPRG